jgi:hypothetical protein
MAEPRPIREDLMPHAIDPVRPLAGVWPRVKHVVLHAIFWTYERGSWQYDVICAVILAFILLTPRAFFNDRPSLGLSDLRHRQGVIEIGRTRAGSQYLIDSRLVDSFAPLKPDSAVRSILQGRLKHPVTIKSMEPILDKNNVMLGYSVVVTP